MIVIYIGIVLILTPFVWWHIILKTYKSLEKIPGPKQFPIIGSVLALAKHPQELLRNAMKLKNEYGRVFKVSAGADFRVFVTDPDLLEPLMSSNEYIEKANSYDYIKQWLGDGLLISKGGKWKLRRKMITPTFHFTILEEFLQVFNTSADNLVKKLHEEVGKTSIDIYQFINLCSLEIICETAMGVKIGAQTEENKEYVSAVSSFTGLLVLRTLSIWMRINFLFRLSPMYRKWNNYIRVLHKFTNNVIETRKQLISKRILSPTPSKEGIKPRIALLDMLLFSSDKHLLTTEDIRAEIDTFVFEGHDTVTSGIDFGIIALADNPGVQEKVYEEIVSVIGDDKNIPITMRHIHDMKYLDMVIKEILRKYPAVPMAERKIHKEYKLGEYVLPKGTIVTIFIYGLHNSEENFPNPEKFDPDRFLPEVTSRRHHFAYLPFSAGPRNCIGQKFATLEMKVIITKIVRNFRLLSVPEYKPHLGMSSVLRSYNGFLVQLQNR